MTKTNCRIFIYPFFFLLTFLVSCTTLTSYERLTKKWENTKDINLIIKALSEPGLRMAAIKVLGETGDTRAVGPLLSELNGRYIGYCMDAAEALGKLCSSEANLQPHLQDIVPFLLRDLNNPHYYVYEDEGDVDYTMTTYDDSYQAVNGDREPYPYDPNQGVVDTYTVYSRLPSGLSIRIYPVREAAFEVLSKIISKYPCSSDMIIYEMKDKDSPLWKNRLRELQGNQVVKQINGRFRFDSARRFMALNHFFEPLFTAEIICKIKDIENQYLVEPLIANRLLSGAVRYYPTFIRTDKIQDPYPVRLPDGALVDCAVETLKKITGQDFGQNPEEWQNWWEQNKETFLKSR